MPPRVAPLCMQVLTSLDALPFSVSIFLTDTAPTAAQPPDWAAANASSSLCSQPGTANVALSPASDSVWVEAVCGSAGQGVVGQHLVIMQVGWTAMQWQELACYGPTDSAKQGRSYSEGTAALCPLMHPAS